MGDPEEAVLWHKRVIEICVHSPSAVSSPTTPFNPALVPGAITPGAGPSSASTVSSSSTAMATSPFTDSTISMSHAQASIDFWAKSALAVGRAAIQKPRWVNNEIGGTLIPEVVNEMNEARKWVQIVAASNAGEAAEAEGLARALLDAAGR
ncbi:hypothetical protein DL93DRAFT_1746423 [Clavulina sp. PMI_390]|nr:hypothetical protein DL93DRAFT_1746423 [Clavulina sp. PMI_390]